MIAEGYYSMPHDNMIRMEPIKTVAHLESFLRSQNRFPFYGILLSTSVDLNVIKYAIENRSDLENLTSDVILVFIAEEKVSVEATHDLPVERGSAYKIASSLEVPAERMPCLLIFNDLNAEGKDLALASLKGNFDEVVASFRRNVDDLRKCLKFDRDKRMREFKHLKNEYLIETFIKDNWKDLLSTAFSIADLIVL